MNTYHHTHYGKQYGMPVLVLWSKVPSSNPVIGVSGHVGSHPPSLNALYSTPLDPKSKSGSDDEDDEDEEDDGF